jgi:hypothetical protein
LIPDSDISRGNGSSVGDYFYPIQSINQEYRYHIESLVTFLFHCI